MKGGLCIFCKQAKFVYNGLCLHWSFPHQKPTVWLQNPANVLAALAKWMESRFFFQMHLKPRVVHLPPSDWRKICCHDPCHQGHILSVSSKRKHHFCLFTGRLCMAPFNILNPTLFPLAVVACASVCWGGVSRNLWNDITVLVSGVEQQRPVIYSQYNTHLLSADVFNLDASWWFSLSSNEQMLLNFSLTIAHNSTDKTTFFPSYLMKCQLSLFITSNLLAYFRLLFLWLHSLI